MNPNVDHAEVQKFSDAAQHWWELSGPCQALHAINPLRLEYMTAKTPFAAKNVIDIGCGGGILTESLAQLGAHVTGIDMSEAAIQVAQHHQKMANLSINYQVTTAEAMAISHAKQFDIVTCLEMLEHVPDPAAIIQACATLLKPGGQLFLSTVNRNVKSFLFAIVGAEYILQLLPKNTHDYQKFIQPSELAEWARDQALTVRDITGLTYNIFTRKYHLCTDVSVNYLMHLTKQIHL